jgi:hypothetical protein
MGRGIETTGSTVNASRTDESERVEGGFIREHEGEFYWKLTGDSWFQLRQKASTREFAQDELNREVHRVALGSMLRP